MADKIIVSGVGCCLVDLLFTNIDFRGNKIHPYLSKKRGDGGLIPGHLVFQEEFEKYSGCSFELALNKITGGRTYENINIGGPSIVSLINLAQLADKEYCEVRFYGRGGNDELGQYLLASLKKTPVKMKDFKLINNRTPCTVVLSDPSFDSYHGERIFLNSIGAAWNYYPNELNDEFFDSDITIFGGTALVPRIHDNMTSLLKKAKSKGCTTVVNTVFDFRNEKENPSTKWPLGESEESYGYIDLLITDKEEALRLSGKQDTRNAIRFFINKKVSSLIITNGTNNISTYSDGRFFNISGLREMPISQKISDQLKNVQAGDTTGCGDNFVGGVMASIVNQLHYGVNRPDLQEACCWGIVSGGFACFYLGGTYFEENSGEKLKRIKPYYESYKKQI